MSSPILFQSHLRSQYGRELEYTEPYKGFLGSYPAEIYNPTGVYQIIEKIRSLNLTVQNAIFELVNDQMQASLPTDPVDVVSSHCGKRGGLIQLIFTNQKALDIFKQTFNPSPPAAAPSISQPIISQPVLPVIKSEQSELQSKHEWIAGVTCYKQKVTFQANGSKKELEVSKREESNNTFKLGITYQGLSETGRPMWDVTINDLFPLDEGDQVRYFGSISIGVAAYEHDALTIEERDENGLEQRFIDLTTSPISFTTTPAPIKRFLAQINNSSLP